MSPPFSVSSVRLKKIGLLCRIVGIVLCFDIYYSFYFMHFNEGEIQGNHQWLNAVKLLGVGAIVLGFAPYRLAARPPRLLWAYIALNGLFLANYLAAHFIYGAGDSLFLNQMLLAPFCILFFATANDDAAIKIMDILLPILLIQALASAALDFSGVLLWQNHAYAGGICNPNSFGLCLVILLTYIWTIRTGKYWLPLSTILMVGALLTQSLMIALTLFLIPIILYAFKRDFLHWAKREGLYILIFSVCSYTGLAFHVNRKMLAILHKFGWASYDVPTGSVEGRLNQIQYVKTATVSHDWLKTLFWGHGDGMAFTPIDPQYLCFALNFGIFFSIAFAALNILFLVAALRAEPKYRAFLFVALLAFNLSFMTNRLLAYFPMGLLYALILGAIFRQQVAVKGNAPVIAGAMS